MRKFDAPKATLVSYIIKGILDPEDAREAVRNGADGLIVSNHGGRQLDGALSTARALPPIADAVGSDTVVLADGGVRSGLDVVRLMALGAKGVLLGRALYVQVIGASFYLAQGEARYARTLDLSANRGRILDRNGQLMASSVPAPSLWAIPKDFKAAPPARVLDMATGSGCIGLSLSKAWPLSEVILADVSEDALDLARLNASRLSANVKLLRSDLFEKITMYDLRAVSATKIQRADGKWDVAIKVDAQKYYANERGDRTIADMNEQFDIGVFTAEPGKSVLEQIAERISAAKFAVIFAVRDTDPQIEIRPVEMQVDDLLDEIRRVHPHQLGRHGPLRSAEQGERLGHRHSPFSARVIVLTRPEMNCSVAE